MHLPHPAPPVWRLGNDALYRPFLESFVDEMYVCNEQVVQLGANPAACDSLGYTRDELGGMHTTAISAHPSEAGLPAQSDHLLYDAKSQDRNRLCVKVPD
jgi:PAS domain S-box-containing protein